MKSSEVPPAPGTSAGAGKGLAPGQRECVAPSGHPLATKQHRLRVTKARPLSDPGDRPEPSGSLRAPRRQLPSSAPRRFGSRRASLFLSNLRSARLPVGLAGARRAGRDFGFQTRTVLDPPAAALALAQAPVILTLPATPTGRSGESPERGLGPQGSDTPGKSKGQS